MPAFDPGIASPPTPRNLTHAHRTESATAVSESSPKVAVARADGTRASLLTDCAACRAGAAQDMASTPIPRIKAPSSKSVDAIQTGFELIRKWRIVRFSASARSVLSGFDVDMISRVSKSASELPVFKNMEFLLCQAEQRYLNRFGNTSVPTPRLTGLLLTWDELTLMEHARDLFLTIKVVWDPVVEIYEEAKYCIEKYVKTRHDFGDFVPIEIHDDAPNRAEQAWTSLIFDGAQGEGALSRSGLQFWGEILRLSDKPISVAIVDQLSQPLNTLPTVPALVSSLETDDQPLRRVVNRTFAETGSLKALKQAADHRWSDSGVSHHQHMGAMEEECEELNFPHLW